MSRKVVLETLELDVPWPLPYGNREELVDDVKYMVEVYGDGKPMISFETSSGEYVAIHYINCNWGTGVRILLGTDFQWELGPDDETHGETFRWHGPSHLGPEPPEKLLAFIRRTLTSLRPLLEEMKNEQLADEELMRQEERGRLDRRRAAQEDLLEQKLAKL